MKKLVLKLSVLIGIVLILSSCSSTSSSTVKPTSTPAPSGMPSFYAIPSKIPSAAGQLIKSVKVTVAGIDGTTYRVMYTSVNEQNQVVPVTGLVFIPTTPAPKGGYRVVAWSHGTNGMSMQCAPSLQPSQAVPSINQLLSQGWEVTASDYQGEGTPPGILAYLVGSLAAKNSLDLVEAVQGNTVFKASKTYIVWGHSEGGQTAMFAWAIGPSYAKNLHLVGVVAGAPPSQFAFMYDVLKTSPYAFYLYMGAVGFNLAYGNKAAPLNEVATPLAIKLVKQGIVTKGCYTYLQNTLDKYSMVQLVSKDPYTVPAWKKLMVANDPGQINKNSGVPLLLIQGTADGQIPPLSTQLLATHLCSIGAEVQRWMYPGQHHAQVIGPSTPDMVHWMGDRFSGQSVPDPYIPTGLPNVLDQNCHTSGGFTTPAP